MRYDGIYNSRFTEPKRVPARGGATGTRLEEKVPGENCGQGEWVPNRVRRAGACEFLKKR
jgi:hypothetical protein